MLRKHWQLLALLAGPLALLLLVVAVWNSEVTTLRFWPTGASRAVPQYALLLGAIVLAVTVGFVSTSIFYDMRRGISWNPDPVSVALSTLILFVVVGVAGREIGLASGMMLLVLGILAIWVVDNLLNAMKEKESIEIQSHWGGLGGGLGGWRLSRPLVLLVLGIVLIGAALGVTLRSDSRHEEKTPADASETTGDGSASPGVDEEEPSESEAVTTPAP